MILRIGNAYGIPVTESMISGFSGIIAASAAGKTIASWIPGVKIGIAAAVTYGVGKAAQRWFENDMQMSEAEIETVFRKSCASYKR